MYMLHFPWNIVITCCKGILLKNVGMTVLKPTGVKNISLNVKGCRDDSAKTPETRLLFEDKDKDIWHEKHGAV